MADDNRAAAYVPWRTFKNALDRLAEGLPGRVDTSAFQNLSGGTRTPLVAALKFLELIDEEERPRPVLKELVKKNELERKPLLREVLESAYAELFKLDLSKATPAQVNEAMGKHYGVSGTTLGKAVRFFLHAAGDLGIPLSPYLQKTSGTRASGTNGAPQRRRRAKPRKPQAPEVTGEHPHRKSGSVPDGFARQDIPTLDGACIIYPINMKPEDFKLFEAAFQFVRAVVEKGGAGDADKVTASARAEKV